MSRRKKIISNPKPLTVPQLQTNLNHHWQQYQNLLNYVAPPNPNAAQIIPFNQQIANGTNFTITKPKRRKPFILSPKRKKKSKTKEPQYSKYILENKLEEYKWICAQRGLTGSVNSSYPYKGKISKTWLKGEFISDEWFYTRSDTKGRRVPIYHICLKTDKFIVYSISKRFKCSCCDKQLDDSLKVLIKFDELQRCGKTQP